MVLMESYHPYSNVPYCDDYIRAKIKHYAQYVSVRPITVLMGRYLPYSS